MSNRWSRQYYLNITQNGTNRQDGFSYLDAEVTNLYSYINALASEALSPSIVVDSPLPNRILLLNAQAKLPCDITGKAGAIADSSVTTASFASNAKCPLAGTADNATAATTATTATTANNVPTSDVGGNIWIA